MTPAGMITERVVSTFLIALAFALLFAAPIRIAVRRHLPAVTFLAVFLTLALAIFVEYWLAAAGGGFVYTYTTRPSSNLVIAAVMTMTVSGGTFIVGAWLLGWGLGAPREKRFEHGALANALMLLCNGALVGIVTGVSRILH